MKNKIWKYTMVVACSVFMGALAIGCSKGADNRNASKTPIVITESFDKAFLSETNVTLRIGETKTISASVNVQEWQSGNEEIVTVSNGIVTAKAAGTAFIYAVTDEGKLSCFINVTNETVTPVVELSSQKKTLRVNDEVVINAVVSLDGNAIDKDVIWSNSDPEIVKTEPNGNVVTVKALKVGTVQIVATVDAVSVVCEITVKATENVVVFFEGYQEMAQVPLTQLSFENGAKVEAINDTKAPVVLYDNAYLGEYENNAGKEVPTIIAYATLAESARKPINLTYENYYNYGFLLEVFQVRDEAYNALVDESYRYYASETANTDGQYGVFIQNIVDGYYRVRAFVEYMDNGEIVCDVSTEAIGLGELEYTVVESTEDINFKIADGNKMSYGTKCDVVAVEEMVEDTTGWEIEAAYKATISDTATAWYNGAKFSIKPKISKAILEELLRSEYTHLVFYAMYQTEATENIEAGRLNLSDELASSNCAETDEKIISSHLVYENWKTNQWYKYEYLVSDLLNCYDVIFAAESNYPFIRMSRKAKEGGEFFLSDFAFEKRFAEPNTLNIDAYIDGKAVDTDAGITFVTEGDVLAASVQVKNPYGLDFSRDYILKMNGTQFDGSFVFKEEGTYVLTATSDKYETVREIYFVVGFPDLTGLGDMSKALVTNCNGGYHSTTTPNNSTLDEAYDSRVELNGKSANHWDLTNQGTHYSVKQIYFTNYYKQGTRSTDYALDKALLEKLKEAGYTTVSFSIAVASDAVTDSTTKADLWILDFAKIKDVEDIESKIGDENYGFANTYMTKVDCVENGWVEVTFNIQDLLDNYDVLDVVPFIVIGHNNSYASGDLYMTDFKFKK